MPTHMRARFHPDELQEYGALRRRSPLAKGVRLLKIPEKSYIGGNIRVRTKNEKTERVLPHAQTPADWKTVLYDLEAVPHEVRPLDDPAVVARMRKLMVEMMMADDAPVEQYTRMGLEAEYAAAVKR